VPPAHTIKERAPNHTQKERIKDRKDDGERERKRETLRDVFFP